MPGSSETLRARVFHHNARAPGEACCECAGRHVGLADIADRPAGCGAQFTIGCVAQCRSGCGAQFTIGCVAQGRCTNCEVSQLHGARGRDRDSQVQTGRSPGNSTLCKHAVRYRSAAMCTETLVGIARPWSVKCGG